MAEKILFLSTCNGEKEIIRRNAANRVKEHYSATETARALLSLYKPEERYEAR